MQSGSVQLELADEPAQLAGLNLGGHLETGQLDGGLVLLGAFLAVGGFGGGVRLVCDRRVAPRLIREFIGAIGGRAS